jgi:hypothetical protein
MATIFKNVLVDITSQLYNGPLLSYQIAQSISKFIHVSSIDNINLKIRFSDTLTVGELTTLDAIVSAHDPNNTTQIEERQAHANSFKTEFLVFSWNSSTANGLKVSNDYEVINYFSNPGDATKYSKVSIVYKVEDKDYSGSFRIYDSTNDIVICEFTLNKGTENDQVLSHIYTGTFENMTITPSMWELQAKKKSSGGKRDLYIISVLLYQIY